MHCNKMIGCGCSNSHHRATQPVVVSSVMTDFKEEYHAFPCFKHGYRAKKLNVHAFGYLDWLITC